MNLYLREIVEDDKKEIESVALEFQNANDEIPFEGVSDLKKVIEKSFEDYYENLEVKKHIEDIYPEYVNQTTYVLTDDNNHIYGVVNLRHEIRGDLINRGGHIGYGIRPSERRKGYATIQLSKVLEKAKEMGINKVLLTCRKANIGSKKTIEKCGGIYENEVFVESNNSINLRYWINI